jgi:hypothetical protein
VKINNNQFKRLLIVIACYSLITLVLNYSEDKIVNKPEQHYTGLVQDKFIRQVCAFGNCISKNIVTVKFLDVNLSGVDITKDINTNQESYDRAEINNPITFGYRPYDIYKPISIWLLKGITHFFNVVGFILFVLGIAALIVFIAHFIFLWIKGKTE